MQQRVWRVLWRVVLPVTTLGLVLSAARVDFTASETGPRRREIRMRGNSFAPRELRATLGDTIVWVNGDIVRHNAVRRELFDSGELKSGERFAWVPTDTGEVQYQCTIHTRMRGALRITAAR